MKQDKFIEHEGMKYARVSTIISKFSDWVEGDPVADRQRENKGRIGTAVHDAIHATAMDKFPILKGDTVDYYMSYLKWSEHIQPVFLQLEKRYFCKNLKITGQIDGIMTYEGLRSPIIIDYKTSVNPSPTWEMQAHFYHYLAKINNENVSDTVQFIQLTKKPDHLPKVHTYKINQNMWNKCKKAIDDFWKSFD